MLKKFDLSYTELMESLNEKKLFGKGTQTINSAIKNLEERYFKGRNIFRNNTKSSDLLFRWEIKNLLLLLIKVEVDNVFGSGKSSKEGVTDLSIRKILDSYDYLNNQHELRNYEKWVLEQSFSAVTSREFVEDISAFEKTMTNFCVLVAKYYDMMPADYIKRIAAVINSFSRGIIDHVQKYQIIENINIPKISIDQYHRTARLRTGPLIINLETAVVKAINTIVDALYDFDDKGCCYRKNLLKATEKFNESYRSIHSEYIKFSEESSFKQKELPGDEVDVDEIRCEVDDLMEYYWEREVKIPHNADKSSIGNSFFKHKSKEKIDEAIEALKKETKFYLQLYFLIKLYVAGRIDRNQFEEDGPGIKIFEEYEKIRNDLMGFKLSDHPFAPVLLKIEKTVWSLFESHLDVSFFEGNKIKEIISTNIDHFINETDMIRYMAKEEFDNIENRKFDGDVLCGVKRNIDQISSDNEDVAKNILSIILKLEADKDGATR